MCIGVNAGEPIHEDGDIFGTPVQMAARVLIKAEGEEIAVSNMVREMQLALLIHRIGTAVDAMPPERVLGMATRGSARLLGRPELGRLRVGDAADVAIFRLDRIDFAGAMHDPASAILFCGSGVRADTTIVNGEILVEGGRLVGESEEDLFHRANDIAARMVAATDRREVSKADQKP